MRRAIQQLRQNRLVLQLLFTLLAAASLAGISIVVIAEAIRSAESVVVGEATKTVGSALGELQQQQQYRAGSDPSWSSLPAAAKNVSLRGITETVLRSYPGVEGGFFSERDRFLGYAYPTHDTGSAKLDVPEAEHGLIEALANRSLASRAPLHEVIRGKMDLIVLGAVRSGNGKTAVWAMKRLSGRANTNNTKRVLLLGILMAAALASIAGTLATGIGLARGVTQIRNGLASLERDFDFRLPERRDELGTISRSVNKMAAARRKLEGDLRREDRLRALGRLATGLAHEIRNPLNSIRLTVQLMEHRLNTGRLRSEDLRTVQAEVDRLSTLLNELLDLQRTRHPELRFQSVLPVVEHCVALVQRQAGMHGVELKMDVERREICAVFDGQQLTQAVMNLLLNALEASKEGDAVILRVREASEGVRVEVQDNGPGLDAEQQEHLFEPFFTTKPAGTGLGLAVSRELMRSQGGDLSCDASTQGARFVVHLRRS
jgi:signal transduction histidine kinase